jgi:hypothetical protein
MGNTKIIVKAVFFNVLVVKNEKNRFFMGKKCPKQKSCHFALKLMLLYVIDHGEHDIIVESVFVNDLVVQIGKRSIYHGQKCPKHKHSSLVLT